MMIDSRELIDGHVDTCRDYFWRTIRWLAFRESPLRR